MKFFKNTFLMKNRKGLLIAWFMILEIQLILYIFHPIKMSLFWIGIMVGGIFIQLIDYFLFRTMERLQKSTEKLHREYLDVETIRKKECYLGKGKSNCIHLKYGGNI